MTTLLVCIAAIYVTVAVFRISQKLATSKQEAILQCPNTWDSLFVLTAILVLFAKSVALQSTLAMVMVLFWFAARFTRQLDAAQRSYQQTGSRYVILLNSTYPLLAIAGLVAWHVWSTYDPAMDPTVQRAQRRQLDIYDSQVAMEEQLVAMHHYLDDFDVPVTDDRYSMNQILDMARELIELADGIIEEYNHLVERHDTFERQIADAPEMYRHAAQVWRQYAMEEQATGNAQMAEEYRNTAQAWDAYANRAETVRGDTVSLEELGEVVFFVGRARIFLSRLIVNSPLAVGADALQEKERFESRVREFVETFDEVRTMIRGLTNQLDSQTAKVSIVSNSVNSTRQPALALDDWHPSRPQRIPRLIREIAASED